MNTLNERVSSLESRLSSILEELDALHEEVRTARQNATTPEERFELYNGREYPAFWAASQVQSAIENLRNFKS